VVLSDDGVPVVVARRSLNGPVVVACRVTDAASAVVAGAYTRPLFGST